jgi:hypothetical protein
MKVLNKPNTVLDPRGLPYIEAEIKYGVATPDVLLFRYDTIQRERTNLVLEPSQVRVYDIGSRRDDISYQQDGFSVIRHKSAVADRANSKRAADPQFIATLRDEYQNEMGDYLRDISGSAHVYAQPIGFFVRHGSKSTVKTAQRPAALPHIDFTEETATRMARLIQEKHAPDLQYRDFAIYQTWRTVTPPPQDNVLCFCDTSTVRDDDFRIVESIMGPENQAGSVYRMEMGIYSPTHNWFYVSNLTADDVLLFQGYDTRSPKPILHTSVNNPAPDALPRVSIECRHYAFFE